MYCVHSSCVRLRLAMRQARACQDVTSTSHRRIVRSALAEARRWPSGLKATLHTDEVCPWRGSPSGWPVSTDHRRIVRSSLGQGYSCRAAAEEAGVGFRAVAKWARAAGIIRKRSQPSAEQLRRSKAAHRAAAQARAHQRQQQRQARRELFRQIRALRRRGLTLREIGARYGHSRQTIARWLRE